MWLLSSKGVTLKIIDSPIDPHHKNILAVIECSAIVCIMYTVIIDTDFIISMNTHMHPKASKPLCF